MRSAWFWSSPQWLEYERHYYANREHVPEWKSSPLANDHDFSDLPEGYEIVTHKTQVIDLTKPLTTLWQDVRKSYHSIIHRANEKYIIDELRAWDLFSIDPFRQLHANANGKQPRPDKTYACQAEWILSGHGLLVMAEDLDNQYVAAAYWIIYQGKGYYCSGPSIVRNVQHAVIWHSLELLKARGVTMVEMGQVDGATDKEKNIGRFKSGFGGTEQTYLVARKQS